MLDLSLWIIEFSGYLGKMLNEGNLANTVVMGPKVLNIKEGLVSSIIFSRYRKPWLQHCCMI